MNKTYLLYKIQLQSQGETYIYIYFFGSFLFVSLLSVPSVVFYHVCHFNDELSFFVFLAVFERVFIFPTQRCFTALAINIGNCMEACQQHTFLSWPATDVHYFIEQISPTLATLERLRNKFIVVSQMSSTMNAAIFSVTLRTQIGLKRFHHVVHL